MAPQAGRERLSSTLLVSMRQKYGGIVSDVFQIAISSPDEFSSTVISAVLFSGMRIERTTPRVFVVAIEERVQPE
jgi:hypothetical protein